MMASKEPNKLHKPANGLEKYQLGTFPNGLEYLFISNPALERPGASLAITAGSFSDPKDIPGLAHLLEHWCSTNPRFKERTWRDYVSERGGYSSAATWQTFTQYYFDMPASNNDADSLMFHEALRQFMHILKTPSDSAASFLSFDEEIAIIQREFDGYCGDDYWKQRQLDRSLANPEHPYHQFEVGHLGTLKRNDISVAKAAIDFHKRYYTTGGAKLVIKSNQSLDVIEVWAMSTFKELPPGPDGLALKHVDVPIYRTEGPKRDVGIETFTKTATETPSLQLRFPYPDEHDPDSYKSRSGHTISQLIGHEGPGSILDFLKTKGWATNLMSGAYLFYPRSSFFDIEIGLTRDGLNHRDEVCQTVFQHIALIRESVSLLEKPGTNLVRDFFEELRNVSKLEFDWSPEAKTWSTCMQLNENMLKPIAKQHLLSGHLVYFELDPEALGKGLEHLCPANLRLKISNDPKYKDTKFEKVEHWYKTEYTSHPIPESLAKKLEAAYNSSKKDRPLDLKLPPRNPFVPETSTPTILGKLERNPKMAPKILLDHNGIKLWYKPDNRFGTPKVNVLISLRHQPVSTTLQSMVSRNVLHDVVQRVLSNHKHFYQAFLTGLKCETEASADSFDITFSGYSLNMLKFMRDVMEVLQNLEVSSALFNAALYLATNRFRNNTLEAPSEQLPRISRWLLSTPTWSDKEIFEVLGKAQKAEESKLRGEIFEEVKKLASDIFIHGQADVLVLGNMLEIEARQVAEIIGGKPGRNVPEQTVQTWRIKSLALAPDSNHYYESVNRHPANVDNGIVYLLYIGSSTDYTSRAKLLLFTEMIQFRYKNTLHIKENLGYYLFHGVWIENMGQAYHMRIQANISPAYLEERLENCLSEFRDELAKWDEVDFETQKANLRKAEEAGDRDLDREGQRLWAQIQAPSQNFQQKKEILERLDTIKKEDMISFYDTYISPASKTRAKLVVSMLSTKSENSITGPIKDSSAESQDSTTVSSDSAPATRKVMKTGEEVTAWKKDLVPIEK